MRVGLERWVLHPLLFATAPVLALLAQNLGQVPTLVGVRSLLLALLIGGLLLAGLRALVGDWTRAAAICSLVLLLFFNYGHAYGYLKDKWLFGMLVGRHRLLLPLGAALLLGGAAWILARGRQNYTLNLVLNAAGLAAVIMPAAQIALFEARTLDHTAEPVAHSLQSGELRLATGETPPDIYYIILDAYGRQDVLQEVYHFDNAPFLSALEEMGFFVARCSLSNYAQTELSLASSLNFNYLTELVPGLEPGSTDRSALWPLIWDSTVRRALKDLGYTDVAFETGYQWTEIENADFFLTASPSSLDLLDALGNVNRFEVMLLDTTGGLFLRDAAKVLPARFQPDLDYPFREHRERILGQFASLREMPGAIQSPKFVFAHLVTPHSPFVFGPEGEPVQAYEPENVEDRIAAYRDQLQYVNGQVLDIVRSILAGSENPPVIILQGDHGPGDVGSGGRLAILNAYYLPGVEPTALPANISPVNSFRWVLNTYFGGQLPLLENRSYFSIYQAPFDWQQVRDPAAFCGQG